jgi:hypothetical protein
MNCNEAQIFFFFFFLLLIGKKYHGQIIAEAIFLFYCTKYMFQESCMLHYLWGVCVCTLLFLAICLGAICARKAEWLVF